jgi:hypothetical protein
LSSEVRHNLLPEELIWLESGNYVKLESFTPARLLRILTSGIAKSRAIDSNEGDYMLADSTGTSFEEDRIYISTFDSFG